MKLRKILLPMATVCATAGLVTPLITSCSGNGRSILEKRSAQYTYDGDKTEMNSVQMKEAFLLANNGTSNKTGSKVLQDTFLVNMSDAINSDDAVMKSIKNVLAKYTVSFDENVLSITDTEIKLNFDLNFETNKEFDLILFQVKDIKLEFEVNFEAGFDFTFINKIGVEKGANDYILLVLTSNGNFNANISITGSCQIKIPTMQDFIEYSYDHTLESVNVLDPSTSSSPAVHIFAKFFLQMFNPSEKNSGGFRIECPYFRNVAFLPE